MSDVFVSYKAEDRRRVKPLVEALQADGFSVWWDEQIGGGSAWRQAIETELNAAKCAVVIWSNRSVGPDGTFVQDEATRAQQRHVYVPVLIDKVHLPLGFGETQALPLTGWRGDRSDPRYEAVLAAVRRNVGGKRRPAASPVQSARVDRRMMIAGGAAAAVAAAGVGGWALMKPSSASAMGSIAVLPFANLSGDPGQAYFSDGVAEEIRSALARIAGLKVVGRTSSEAVRNDDAETAAKKLGVANILSGSVRQSPSTIRISAELIDGRTGIDRWSQDYDRSPGDSIKIQTDIAENVATALSAALGGAARAAVSVGGTANAAAQKLILQAQARAIKGRTGGDIKDAQSLIDAAISLDPGYAEAYAFKAFLLNIYASTFANGFAELAADRAEAMRLAKISLRLAPALGAAHLALAEVYRVLLDFRPAAAEYRRALDLAPGDATALQAYCAFISRLGQASEALQLADKVIALDPLNAHSYNTRFSALRDARRWDDAVRYSEQVRRKSADLFIWPEYVGLCLVLLGRFGDAQQYFDQAAPVNYNRLVGESVLLIRTGQAGGVPAKIKQLEQAYGEAASYQLMQIYSQLGDKSRALAALDQAWAIRDSGLTNLKIDAFVDPLRGEPRFKAVLAKLNFPS
jgi:TolB-like protein/Tfp pilus assembly protein PilF